MISAAVLDAMLAAGATAEQIVSVVKAAIAGEEDRLLKQRERTRRCRDRQKDNEPAHVTLQNVTSRYTAPIIKHARAQADAPAEDSSSSSVDTGKKNKKDIKRSIPVDTWKPPDDLPEFAKRLGFSPSLYAREIDKLRDWARAKGEVKKDWTAAARNWLRTAATDQNLLPLEPLETAGTVEVFRTDGRWEFLAARYERENGRNLRHAQKWPFPQGWLEGNGSLAERQTG